MPPQPGNILHAVLHSFAIGQRRSVYPGHRRKDTLLDHHCGKTVQNKNLSLATGWVTRLHMTGHKVRAVKRSEKQEVQLFSHQRASVQYLLNWYFICPAYFCFCCGSSSFMLATCLILLNVAGWGQRVFLQGKGQGRLRAGRVTGSLANTC